MFVRGCGISLFLLCLFLATSDNAKLTFFTFTFINVLCLSLLICCTGNTDEHAIQKRHHAATSAAANTQKLQVDHTKIIVATTIQFVVLQTK